MFTEKEWRLSAPLNQLEADIYQLRLPLPFALDHVNVYLLRGDAGWTIVDTGLNISAARKLWIETFEQLSIGVGDVEKIVLTHMHPDHFGLAGWLQGYFSTDDHTLPVYTSASDRDTFSSFWGTVHSASGDMSELFTLSGIPPEYADGVVSATLKTVAKTEPHPAWHVLQGENGEGDKDQFQVRLGNRSFTAILAPGHADGQYIFYDEADQLILSGDQVLMKITPNIGYWQNTEPGVLQRYIDSLRSLSALKVRVGLPGHKWLIRDWQQRIEEMFAHHDERLEATLRAIRPGITLNEISQAVFRLQELNVHQARFAIVETRAHVELLETRGEVAVEEVDGIWRYRLT